MLQYKLRKLDALIRVGRCASFACSVTSRLMSYADGCGVCRYGSGGGSCSGPFLRNGSSASIVTIHGEIDVPKFFARNGPSGTYSHFWMSRALQSFTSTMPKM